VQGGEQARNNFELKRSPSNMGSGTKTDLADREAVLGLGNSKCPEQLLSFTAYSNNEKAISVLGGTSRGGEPRAHDGGTRCPQSIKAAANCLNNSPFCRSRKFGTCSNSAPCG
jgi:hypothetical protein